MVVLWAILAAGANALSSVLQRRAARSAPKQDALSLRLVVDLVRRPAWFAGMASLLAGFGLQALALHTGRISEVEPILIAELPLTLLFAAGLFKVRLRRRDLATALVMSLGLAILLFAGAPAGGHVNRVKNWTWLVTGLAVVGACAALVTAGWRTGGDHRAALWGIAAGAGFGLAAALIKASTALLDQGVGSMLLSWKPYVMALAGVGALYLFENAVQAGSLIAAQPAISLTDPLVSVAIGVVVFGEHFRTGLLVIAELVAIAMIAGGTVALARSPLIAAEPHGGGVAQAPARDG